MQHCAVLWNTDVWRSVSISAVVTTVAMKDEQVEDFDSGAVRAINLSRINIYYSLISCILRLYGWRHVLLLFYLVLTSALLLVLQSLYSHSLWGYKGKIDNCKICISVLCMKYSLSLCKRVAGKPRRLLLCGDRLCGLNVDRQSLGSIPDCVKYQILSNTTWCQCHSLATRHKIWQKFKLLYLCSENRLRDKNPDIPIVDQNLTNYLCVCSKARKRSAW